MDSDVDEGKRPTVGVVVSLLDMGDGTCRVILDDVRSDGGERDCDWKFDQFYTHKRFDSQPVDNMALSDSEYQGLGTAVLARLLALNGRGK